MSERQREREKWGGGGGGKGRESEKGGENACTNGKTHLCLQAISSEKQLIFPLTGSR